MELLPLPLLVLPPLVLVLPPLILMLAPVLVQLVLAQLVPLMLLVALVLVLAVLLLLHRTSKRLRHLIVQQLPPCVRAQSATASCPARTGHHHCQEPRRNLSRPLCVAQAQGRWAPTPGLWKEGAGNRFYFFPRFADA